MRNTPERRQQLGEFFTANDDRLHRAVARKINAPHQLIADACADAWTILLRRPDITLDERGFRWLVTVAINEALMLLRRTRGETSVGTFGGDSRARGREPEPADTEMSVAEDRALELIAHAQRVRLFRKLKPREREALYLKALGYSYGEIARATDSTYTSVNRRLTEGRARLRRLARERAEPDGDEQEKEGANHARPRPTPGMTFQPICYRGRTVAAATRTRFVLAETLDQRPISDPERTFVIFMCAYAGDVLSGVLPGPYTDEDARRYARACLMPAELLEHPTLDIEHVARALRLPADELRVARADQTAGPDACSGV